MAISYPNSREKVPDAPDEKSGIYKNPLLAEFRRIVQQQGPKAARTFLREKVKPEKHW